MVLLAGRGRLIGEDVHLHLLSPLEKISEDSAENSKIGLAGQR
jgi:hypothetical protein